MLRITVDPDEAAVPGNIRLMGIDEAPAATFPRSLNEAKFVAATPLREADVIVTPVATPEPVTEAVTGIVKVAPDRELPGVGEIVTCGPRTRLRRADIIEV